MEKAVEHALAIAEPDDEILILWIIPEPDPSFFLDIPEEFSIEEASDHLDSLKAKYQNTKLQIITKVCQGNIIEEILKESLEPLKSEEIVIKTGLSLRSVRYGMKLLMESEKITKYPDLNN